MTCSSDGAFDEASSQTINNFKKLRTAALAVYERLRVAYVPAGNCHPNHENPVHQRAPSDIFGRFDWIATPTLMDLREQREKDTGGHALLKSKGFHCTKYGRLWLHQYLFRWAIENRVSLLFCVGWNSNDPELEYRKQVELEVELVTFL